MASRGNKTRQIGRLTDEDWGTVMAAAKIKQAPNVAAYCKQVILHHARKTVAHNRMIKKR